MAAPAFEYEGFEEARSIARRRRKRVVLPIAVVIVMLLALLGIALYDYKAMRSDALALSEGVIINLQSRIETEVAAYLEPIAGIVQLTRDVLADTAWNSVSDPLTETLGIGLLGNAPQLTAIFVGTPGGEFLMVRRHGKDEEAGLETKMIKRISDAADGFEITFTRRGANHEIVSSQTQPWDQYDPRTRPWYQGASERRNLYWTDVYPFFTDRAAGVTAAVPLPGGREELRAVVGADVTLESLNLFLQSLTIGRTGLALIFDKHGHLIAHPQAEMIKQGTGGKLRLTKIGDLDDPVANRAFDRFRVEGHGRRDFELNGRRYISSVSSLSGLVKRDWSILVVVPEDDFIGFVVDNVGETLMMGFGVILLATVLAALLIRLGLRADRQASRILERQAELDAQGDALGQLAAADWSASETQQANTLATVSEAVAKAARVRRAGIWVMDAESATLSCIDCFDRETNGHTQGARLDRLEHPELFAALGAGQTLKAVDAASDPRLSTLHRHYLAPLGCRAFVGTPISSAGGVRATIWLEDSSRRSQWPNHTLGFVQAVASLLATRPPMSAPPGDSAPGTRQEPTSPGAANAPPPVRSGSASQSYDIDTSLIERRAAAFVARLAVRSDGISGPRAEVIGQLAVMSLRFTDAMALAEPAEPDSDEAAVTYLLHELQHAAGEHDIAYLKFLSDQVVAAVDPAVDADTAVQRIADYAMQARDVCETVLARHQAPLSFRIGIDLGPGIASIVDRSRKSFAFWGEAVQTAGTMADAGLPGAIQVTESVYQRLRDRFLFQSRGHHYLEGVGEFSTYLMGGRL